MNADAELPRTKLGEDWSALVSVGANIKLPGKLVSSRIGDVVAAIAYGHWAEQVDRVRKLRHGTSEQAPMKEKLPYWTPAGLFSYRSNKSLIRHSGHVGVDLDNLGKRGATRAVQIAVDDRHCVCAFRSASARGVRLIFPCPPCSAQDHKRVFERVADHVRRVYGVEPDGSGADVCRAAFASYDRGLWLNLDAAILPGLAQLSGECEKGVTHKDSLCVTGPLPVGDVNTLAYGLGESRACRDVKADGTAYTHQSLLGLGRDLVVRFRRHGLTLTLAEKERAFRAWWQTGIRNGMRFRLPQSSYRAELDISIRCAERATWLPRVTHFWLRWTHAPEFPADGSPRERLEWAVTRHCVESGNTKFYLSARDAATITGTCFKTANNWLHRLVSDGVLRVVGQRKHARHARTFRLKER